MTDPSPKKRTLKTFYGVVSAGCLLLGIWLLLLGYQGYGTAAIAVGLAAGVNLF